MDVKDLKRLLDAIAEAKIAELTLETGDYKLTVKRGAEASVAAAPQPSPAPQPTASQAATAVAEPPPPPEPAEKRNLVEITAPIVGTFYAAPAPDAPPYVKVGDRVKAGQVLCIIEAMKLMNEIKAEVAGTVKQVLVENGQPVEYDQPLFVIVKG